MLKTVSDSKKISIALIYPGNSFLTKPLCQALLRHHCQVTAVAKEFAENLLPLFDREGFTFLYFADFEKKPPKEVDYIFEIGNQGELLSLAKKYQAKYEAVLEKENNQLTQKLKKQKLDYRLAIGHQVFGPEMKFKSNDFVTQALKAGVERTTLKVPGNGLDRIYPLFTDDFARGALQAMFAPGTTGQIFDFFGRSITAFSFAHLIKKATKGESRVKFVKSQEGGKITKPDLKTLKELQQKLDWKPKKDLEKALKKTIWEIKEAQTEVKDTGKVKDTEDIKDIRDTKDTQMTKTAEIPKPSKLPRESLFVEALADKERVEIEEPVFLPVDLAKKQEKIQLVLKQAQERLPAGKAGGDPSSKAGLATGRGAEGEETRQVSPQPSKPPKPSRKPWRFLKIFFLSLSLCLLLLSAPFGLIGYQAYQGISHLGGAKQALAGKDFNQLNQQLQKARTNFANAQNILFKTEPILEALKLESAFFVFNSYLSVGRQVTDIGILATQAANLASSFFQKLLVSQPVDINQFVVQENQLTTQLISEISLVEARLKQQDSFKANLPFFQSQKYISQIEKYLPASKKLAKMANESLPLLPSLLAQNSRKTYLVLFQNNMELRPTGGFIGSFGLVTFEKGRFLDFGVLDVYTADGQLKGHVEPPAKLKEYLGEAGWYLRDSNWDPDFPTSARKSAWFLEKEMGRTVDGVIAINLNFAQKVLASLGEIYLPDYNEKINAANLFERAEYHSEIGTFPGSTQKSDFLGSLANAIFEKIKAGEEKGFLGVAQASYQSLEEQDVLVYLNDPEAMEAIQKFAWSGKITPAINYQLSTISYPDFLMLVETNVGVNKANFFVNRKIDQKIEIDQERKVTHLLKITYQNTAQTDAWPAGKYKNYLRVYTPQGSKQSAISNQQSAIEFEEFLEHGKTVFATLVEVPINEEKTIEIAYELPERMPQQERVSYLLFFQKQSGMINTTNSILFSFPMEIKPLLISPAGSYSPGSLLFADSLEKSRTYRIEFVR